MRKRLTRFWKCKVLIILKVWSFYSHALHILSADDSGKSQFSGRGWGQQLFSFQSPAVQWMARTSSLNCLSCRNPYQTPNSLNCLPPFHWKTLFFPEKCFVASPSPKSALIWVLSTDSKSSADRMYRACESKDQTLKKIRTLHFPDQYHCHQSRCQSTLITLTSLNREPRPFFLCDNSICFFP